MPRRDPWVYIGLVAFFALLFVALFGERIAPHEPIYYVVEHGRDPRPYDPGVVFPFGSDILGRDLFSVVLAGARTTLIIVTLGGAARVLAGVLVAAFAMWWRPVRLLVEGLGELVASVPATLIALGIVKVFVRSDASIFVFVGALLVTGWAGPYRLVRVELERLAHLPFTEGAVTLGVRRFAIFRRHYLPHLVPVLAVNLSQQVIASLVLLAELGVLGVAVGSVRSINIEESLTVVRTGPATAANISDPVEWGGLLANARSIESLWTTRWLFLVPGIAFALTAVAVAAIGFGIARHYARRNIIHDLRARPAAALALVTLAFFAASVLVPERYAEAGEWAQTARAGARGTVDVETAFRAAGLRPLADTFALERDTTKVVKTGTATVQVGKVTLDDETSPPTEIRVLAYSETGGGTVEAPLVFVGRGVSPKDYPPIQTSIFQAPDLGTTIKDFADDYAAVDIRGKVAVLTRFAGVDTGSRRTAGPDAQSMIENALKRAPAAVLFVDPLLSRYVQVSTSFATPIDPYTRLETSLPITEPHGIPVIVVNPSVADRLLAPLGVEVAPFLDFLDSKDARVSKAHELAGRAKVSVPLERVTAHVRTLAAETAVASAARPPVMIWAVRRPGAAHPSADVISSVTGLMSARRQPFVFVDFDASVDPNTNARDVFERLAGQRIALIVVLDQLDGSALTFATVYGDLIPAMDRYAERAGAAHVVTRSTTRIADWSWPGIRPFIDMRAILVRGNGGAGDVRGDAAAFIGYLGARAALGDEEFPR